MLINVHLDVLVCLGVSLDIKTGPLGTAFWINGRTNEASIQAENTFNIDQKFFIDSTFSSESETVSQSGIKMGGKVKQVDSG